MTRIYSSVFYFITSNINSAKGKSVPLQAWSGPEGSKDLRFPDFMTTAQDGGKVVSLTNRLHLPQGNTPGTHFCWKLGRPQGHSAVGRISCQWKTQTTPAGIETAAFRFVAQHLNHCATAVPHKFIYKTNKISLPTLLCFLLKNHSENDI